MQVFLKSWKKLEFWISYSRKIKYAWSFEYSNDQAYRRCKRQILSSDPWILSSHSSFSGRHTDLHRSSRPVRQTHIPLRDQEKYG